MSFLWWIDWQRCIHQVEEHLHLLEAPNMTGAKTSKTWEELQWELMTEWLESAPRFASLDKEVRNLRSDVNIVLIPVFSMTENHTEKHTFALSGFALAVRTNL